MHFKIPPSMQGYEVKNGRLINNAAPLQTGLQTALELKKAMKMVEENLLRLDESILKYISDGPKKWKSIFVKPIKL